MVDPTGPGHLKCGVRVLRRVCLGHRVCISSAAACVSQEGL